MLPPAPPPPSPRDERAITTLTDLFPLLLTALHVATAGAVTAHAVLRKRNVSAAIGWIGLAWLSPVLGPLLYLGFGINRVQRRARRLKADPAKPQADSTDDPAPFGSSLQAAVAGITGRATAPGSVLAVLRCGDEAYPRMLAAIDGAQTSIAMSSYILRADETGHAFIDALARAHRRGVAVRVLIDGFGGGFPYSAAHARLVREGVPAARHLHSLLPWQMPFLNLRLHKKILVVDGVQVFLGGMNIGAENQASTAPSWPVCDTQFLIEGPVVEQVMAGFREDWAFATGENLEGADWFPATYAPGRAPARVILSGPDQNADRLMFVLLAAINAAERSIRIATPYFLPDEQILTALQLAVARGVAVDIVVPEVGDHRIVNWAVTAHIRPLLDAGCRIWRSPPPFDHSKLATIDGYWSLIGSANWDARSFRLNFEITMEFYDRDLAARLADLIDGQRGEAITLDEIDARSPVVKVRDAAARLLMPYM